MPLFKRAPAQPASAFSVQPSLKFDVQDGNWSTFAITVGNSGSSGPQTFRVVVSTLSYDLWLFTPDSCVVTNPDAPTPPTDCAYVRGVGYYNGAQSLGYEGNRSNTGTGGSRMEPIDLGNLNLDPMATLNGTAVGDIWEDSFTMSSSTAPTTTRNASVPIFAIDDPFSLYSLCSIGIGVGVREIDNVNWNSTVSSMAAAGSIPSRSWGYTAGAYYRKYSSPCSCFYKFQTTEAFSSTFRVLSCRSSLHFSTTKLTPKQKTDSEV
jgi:hypothetical protein